MSTTGVKHSTPRKPSGVEIQLANLKTIYLFVFILFLRHLSHKFHGKGSGKLKSEKRAKKQEDKMVNILFSI